MKTILIISALFTSNVIFGLSSIQNGDVSLLNISYKTTIDSSKRFVVTKGNRQVQIEEERKVFDNNFKGALKTVNDSLIQTVDSDTVLLVKGDYKKSDLLYKGLFVKINTSDSKCRGFISKIKNDSIFFKENTLAVAFNDVEKIAIRSTGAKRFFGNTTRVIGALGTALFLYLPFDSYFGDNPALVSASVVPATVFYGGQKLIWNSYYKKNSHFEKFASQTTLDETELISESNTISNINDTSSYESSNVNWIVSLNTSKRSSYLRSGVRIKINVGKEKFKGEIEQITNDTIILVSNSGLKKSKTFLVPINNIDVIQVRTDGSKRAWGNIIKTTGVAGVLLCVSVPLLRIWSDPIVWGVCTIAPASMVLGGDRLIWSKYKMEKSNLKKVLN